MSEARGLEKRLGMIAVAAALVAQLGTLIWWGAQIDNRLAGVESKLAGVVESTEQLRTTANDAAAGVAELRERVDGLRQRLDAHDNALMAVGRIEERLTAQQRQLDRLEVLLDRGRD